MAFAPVFQRPFSGTFDRNAAAAAAAAWWVVAGKTCVAAYQPKGAATYDASKINLCNPGTYDAANGTQYPTWNTVTGWLFNGTSQYLTTGVHPSNSYSMLCQFSTVSGADALCGIQGSVGDTTSYYRLYPNFGGIAYYGNGNQAGAGAGSGISSGNMAVAGYTGYKNGVLAVAITPGGTIEPGLDIYIGASHDPLGATEPWNGYITAWVVYSDTLAAGEVATVSAAMAAL